LSFPPPIGVEGRLRRESILQTISTIWIPDPNFAKATFGEAGRG